MHEKSIEVLEAGFYFLQKSRARREKLNKIALLLSKKRRSKKWKIVSLISIFLILSARNTCVARPRREERNHGWFSKLWTCYSDKRFKEALRVNRDTFNFILEEIRPGLERKTHIETPISPEERLAIALYHYGR